MGTYTLAIRNHEPFERAVGAQGPVRFPAGTYAYTGSVPGTSFARVRRHMECCEGERETTHWHVDYLLTAETTEILAVFTTSADAECRVVSEIELPAFGELGASDCTECRSHFHHEDAGTVLQELARVYERRQPSPTG